MGAIRVETKVVRRQSATMQHYYDQVKAAINEVTKSGVTGWQDGKTKEYLAALTETATGVSGGIGIIREYRTQLDSLVDMMES